MIKKLEAVIFGKIWGRVIARLAVSAAAYIAAGAASKGVNVDPAELSAALIAGANAAYSAIKEWRDKRANAAAPAAVEAHAA